MVLEATTYEKLTLEHKRKLKEKILSNLDKRMKEILALKVPAHQKMQLYNEVLQKLQLYMKKTRRRETIKLQPLSETDIVKGYRKTAQFRKILKAIRDNKSFDWNDEGTVISLSTIK